MAFSFTDLQNDIDKFQEAAAGLQGLYATVDAKRDALVGQLHSTGIKDLYGDGYQIFTDTNLALDKAQTELVQLFKRRVLDRAKTQEQFPELYDGSVEEALRAIYRQMVADSSYVTANTVSVSAGPTKTTAGSNTGNLYVTNKLPGNIAPGEGLIQYAGLQGVSNQMAEADSVVCITTDGQTAYLSGRPPRTVPYGGQSVFGNRGYVAIPMTGGNNLAPNFFEDITSNVPDGWTLAAGSAGSTILEETSTVWIGAKSISLNGANTLSFPIASLVQSRQNLLLSCWFRKHASTSAGTYTLRMTGTGMATQTASWNATDLSSSAWTEKTIHLAVPAVIPSDLAIELVTASVSASGIYADGGILQPYVYWAGFGWAITVGQDNFAANDKWVATISNDYAGARQTWMARSCGFQLHTT